MIGSPHSQSFMLALPEPLPEHRVGLRRAQKPAGKIDQPFFHSCDALEKNLGAAHREHVHLAIEQLDPVFRLVDLLGERVEVFV